RARTDRTRRITAREQLQPHRARARLGDLGVRRRVRSRSRHDRADDREFSFGLRVAAGSPLSLHSQGFAPRGIQRRLAVVWDRATKTMLDAPAVTLAYADPHEREHLANVSPTPWRNPTPRSRYDLVIIGAGPAGLVAARVARSLGASVALIERHLLGGGSLNYGSIPSKTIIRTARLYADVRMAAHFGAEGMADIRVDFAAAMARMRRIRSRISRIDSAARLVAQGIDLFFGRARFVANDTVEVDGVRLQFK